MKQTLIKFFIGGLILAGLVAAFLLCGGLLTGAYGAKPSFSGINSTLLAQGYSQRYCDSVYGKNFCNVTVNTLDWVVLEDKFRQMEKPNKSSFMNVNSPTGSIYPILPNKLPNYFNQPAGKRKQVIIDFQGTNVNYNGDGLIARASVLQEAANNTTVQYMIYKAIFIGQRTGTAIWIDGSYDSDLSSNNFFSFDYGVHCSWCMGLKVNENGFWFQNKNDIWAGTGQGLYVGATDANSQSNIVTINNYHSFGGGTLKAGIYLYNISCIVINQPNFDAGGGFDYGIVIEGWNNSYMKNVDINQPYVETVFRKAFLKDHMQDGIVNVVGGYMQAVGVLFEFGGQTTKAQLNITNFSLSQGATYAVESGAQGTINFSGNNNLVWWNGFGAIGISDPKFWVSTSGFVVPRFSGKLNTVANGVTYYGSWLQDEGNTGGVLVTERFR